MPTVTALRRCVSEQHGVAALRALALGALLVAASAAPALAQDAARPIEQQMSTQEFRAAGLDKLSAAELAALNAWLNRAIDVETTKAAESAKQAVVNENRGLMIFGSSEPIVARIAGEFRGFGKGRSYTLDSGQVWQQIDEATLAGVRKDSPAVRITPSMIGNAWYLSVEGYNSRAKVQRVK